MGTPYDFKYQWYAIYLRFDFLRNLLRTLRVWAIKARSPSLIEAETTLLAAS